MPSSDVLHDENGQKSTNTSNNLLPRVNQNQEKAQCRHHESESSFIVVLEVLVIFVMLT